MSKAASSAAAAAAAAAVAAAAAAREAQEDLARQPQREIDFSTFSDEALHAYVTHYKLAPHFPPRSLLTSAIQSSGIPPPASTPSDNGAEDEEDEEAGETSDAEGAGAEGEQEEQGEGEEGQPPRKKRRRLRSGVGESDVDKNGSLISTAHIIPNGGTNTRKRAAAVAAAAGITASSLSGAVGSSSTSGGYTAASGAGAENAEDEIDPEEAAALEQLADVHAARAYLSRAVSRHFASLPAPKEGEVVVGFLYRAKIRDKVLKIADYTPPAHLV
ncbi:hypothetical protein CF319_g437 [Tilletia indica]|nr:hypothetical protein CF319_g437 [Tilletia indica]KAE8231025.1 hypothetical protein CF326_g3968 [Tilletia indica]